MVLNWQMNMKLTKMILPLFVILAACAPISTGTHVVAYTPISPTEISTFTQESTPVIIAPTSMPPQPIISMITPDPTQVKDWKGYEAALAIALFPPKNNPQSPDEFVCEWEILGQSNQEVYVWTVCMSIFSVGSAGLPYHIEMPAVIYIGANGTVQSVEIPRGGSHYASDIHRMFPKDAQEKYFGKLIHFQELTDHLRWRREHPEEPPLIIIGIAPTPMPTQLTTSVFTPDLDQVEHWKEYQTALAESLFFLPEETLCEWDILGTSEQALYVWVVCESILPFGATSAGRQMYSSSSTPAVVHLAEDGTIQSVEIPAPGISDYARLFPVQIQNRFEFYRLGRAKELSDHIQWRREHTEEPPMIVLSATPTP